MQRVFASPLAWLRDLPLKAITLASLITAAVFLSSPAQAQMSNGQTLYVPAYSHIYIGHKASPYKLTVTLSIRNIDPKFALELLSVDYYGTEGKLIKHHLDTPLTLGPMASTRYVIPAPDKTGGSGANFIVSWKADQQMNAPIVESIMIGTQSQQGISFTSRGQVIHN